MGEVECESVKRLCAGARAQPEDRRDAWLANACAEPAVRAEVRSLLDSLERAGSFLEDSGLASLVAAGRGPGAPVRAGGPARTICDRRTARRWRHGRGLPRVRHAARSNGGPESAPGADGCGSRVAGASGAGG